MNRLMSLAAISVGLVAAANAGVPGPSDTVQFVGPVLLPNAGRSFMPIDLNGDGVEQIVRTIDGGFEILDTPVGPGFATLTTLLYTDRTAFARDLRDIDGNGTLDVLTVGASGETGFTIYLRDQPPGETTVIDVPTDTRPRHLLFGDLNADGHVDVIANTLVNGNSIHHSFETYISDGMGAFTPGDSVEYVGADLKMAVGNFDAFPGEDVTIEDSDVFDPHLVVFGFSPSGDFIQRGRSERVLGPRSLRVADVNDDGFDDVVGFDFRDFYILLSDGSGNLDEVFRFAPERRGNIASPFSIEIVDLDDDGDPDLVFIADGDAAYSTNPFLNDGNGKFTRADPMIHGEIEDAVIVDATGDGNRDMLVRSERENRLYLFRGAGGLNFERFLDDTDLGMTDLPNEIVKINPSDIDQDGDIDLVVLSAAETDPRCSIYFNDGQGQFVASTDFQLSGFGGSGDIECIDMNRDGATDIVIRTGGGAFNSDLEAGVIIAFNDGSSTAWVPASPLTSDADRIDFIAVGDLNGDDAPDIVATTQMASDDTGTNRLLINDGAGSFQEAEFPAPDAITMVPLITDSNADGNADILLLTTRGGSLQLEVPVSSGLPDQNDTVPYARTGGTVSGKFESITLDTYFGNGTSTFAASPSNPTILPASRIFAGDLNGDGFPDLLTDANPVDPRGTSVSLNDGAGSYTKPSFIDFVPEAIPIASQSRFMDLVYGDFSGDGITDIATNFRGGRLFGIRTGRGDGTFRDPALHTSMFGRELALGDINGDGALDAISFEYGEDARIYVLPGVPAAPGPCSPADLASPRGVLDLADIVGFTAAFLGMEQAADLNPDGVFDLADVTAFIAAFGDGCP